MRSTVTNQNIATQPTKLDCSQQRQSAALVRLKLCALALTLVGIAGLALTAYLNSSGLSSNEHYTSNNIFYFLYQHYERWFLLLLATTGLACFFWLDRVSIDSSVSTDLPLFRSVPAMLSILVFGVCAAGTHIVFLNYPFSMDEFYSGYQAQIFAMGHLKAVIPEDWRLFERALTPISAAHNSSEHTWMANYLPVYAILRTPFLMVGIESLLNPLLATGTVLAISYAAGRIWPGKPMAIWGSALLLATSPQFLITSMTAYAMPAHLFFNMSWLALYLRNDRKGDILAPWIGLLAIGLHQPNVHVIFAAPFVMRMLFDRRWNRFFYYATVYLLAAILCFWFMNVRYPGGGGDGESAAGLLESSKILRILSLPGPRVMMDQFIGMTQVFSWQHFAVSILAVFALCKVRSLSAPVLDLLIGMAMAAFFYFLFPQNQGHGWGNRYFYPYLGGFVILAVAGWIILWNAGLSGVSRNLVIASSVLAMCLLLPMRSWEARSVTSPFAMAAQWLREVPEDIVILNSGSIWYGQDLVRNDPWLSGSPKILFLRALNRKLLPELEARGTIRYVQFEDVKFYGMSQRLPISR